MAEVRQSSTSLIPELGGLTEQETADPVFQSLLSRARATPETPPHLTTPMDGDNPPAALSTRTTGDGRPMGGPNLTDFETADPVFKNLMERAKGGPSTTTMAEPSVAPTSEVGVGGEFTRGLSRGLQQEAGLYTALGGTIAQLFGSAEAGQDLFTRAQDIIKEAERTDPAAVGTIEEAITSPGKFARWAAGVLGEQVPIIATIVASGGIGSILTRVAAKGVISKELSKETLRRATQAGGTGGAFSMAAGLETGGSALEQLEAGAQEADPMLSLAAGATKGSLEIITPFVIARRIGIGLGGEAIEKLGNRIFDGFARRGLPTRIAGGALGLGGTEALTEGIQEAVDLAVHRFVDENFDVLGEQAKSRLLNAAASGFLAGGLPGGVLGGLQPRIEKATDVTEEDLVKAAFVPERGREGDKFSNLPVPIPDLQVGNLPVPYAYNIGEPEGFEVGKEKGMFPGPFIEPELPYLLPLYPGDPFNRNLPVPFIPKMDDGTWGDWAPDEGPIKSGKKIDETTTTMPTGVGAEVTRNLAVIPANELEAQALSTDPDGKDGAVKTIELGRFRPPGGQDVVKPVATLNLSGVDMDSNSTGRLATKELVDISKANSWAGISDAVKFMVRPLGKGKTEFDDNKAVFEALKAIATNHFAVHDARVRESILYNNLMNAGARISEPFSGIKYIKRSALGPERFINIAPPLPHAEYGFSIEEVGGTFSLDAIKRNITHASNGAPLPPGPMMTTVSFGGEAKTIRVEDLSTHVAGLPDGSVIFMTTPGVTLTQGDKDYFAKITGIYAGFAKKARLKTSLVVMPTAESGIGGRFTSIPLGQGKSYGVISLRSMTSLQGTSETLIASINTAMHEYGHFLVFSWLLKQPVEVQNRLRVSYNRWRESVVNATAREYVQKSASYSVSRINIAMRSTKSSIPGGIGPDSRPQFLPIGERDYWYNFDEYMAEQSARWLMSKKPAVGIIEKFYKDLAKLIGEFFEYFNQKYHGLELSEKVMEPDAAIDAWLDELFNRKTFNLSAITKQVADIALPWSRTVNASVTEEEFERTPTGQEASFEVKTLLTSPVMQGVASVAQRKKAGVELDKFNWFIKTFWNILQVAEKNQHIPGVSLYAELLNFWSNTKMRWIVRGDTRVKEWNHLGKDMGNRLAKFVFDVDAMDYLKVGENPRWPTVTELQAIARKHKLSAAGLQMYGKIKDDFLAVLDAIQDALEKDALKSYSSVALQANAIREIRADIAKMKARPYFPHARFGKFTIIVYDNADNKVFAAFAETELGQRNQAKALEKRFPKSRGYRIGGGKIPEEFDVLKGMPPSMLKALSNKLTLTPTQRKALEDLIFAASPAQSFKHHLEKRSNIEGFSLDAQRGYANYFFHGANHLARLMWGGELQDAITMVKDSSNLARRQGRFVNKRDDLTDYLQNHLNYILTPRNEWAFLRSLAFQYWLGFSPVSAMINLTQIPMVAYPYLAARFNDASAIAQLTGAAKDFGPKRIYNKKVSLKPDELKAYGEAVNQGFVDESQATELAAVSEGSNLQRILPSSSIHRGIKHLAFWSGWMFQQAEKFNRRVVFLGAYRLAKNNPQAKYLNGLKSKNVLLYGDLINNSGFTPEEAIAFLAGKDAVDKTQFQYAAYARPRFMRGKSSVLFTFFMFKQHMLWFTFYSPGRGRFLLILLAMGGLMGLPGFEDIDDIVRLLARRLFGSKFSVEEEVRKFAKEIGFDKPDLLLHGFGRYGLGTPEVFQAAGIPWPSVDLSGSIGQGRVLPGLEPFSQILSQQVPFEKGITGTSQEVLGATLSVPFTILQAMSDTSPDEFKKWERILPRAMRGAAKAHRYYEEGREKTKNGATVLRFDVHDPMQLAEIVAQGLGFTPTRLSQKWDLIRAQREAVQYWTVRRGMLMAQLDHARVVQDREGMADVMSAIKRFNLEVKESGHPELGIAGKALVQSAKSRARERLRFEQGTTTEKAYRGVSKEVKELFPEVEELKKPSQTQNKGTR